MPATAHDLISEIIAHLRAAQMQHAPSDDAIIAEHIDAALQAAKQAQREMRGAMADEISEHEMRRVR